MPEEKFKVRTITDIEALEKIPIRERIKAFHGSLFTITITPSPGVSEETIREKAVEVLARYTVRYQLIFG